MSDNKVSGAHAAVWRVIEDEVAKLSTSETDAFLDELLIELHDFRDQGQEARHE